MNFLLSAPKPSAKQFSLFGVIWSLISFIGVCLYGIFVFHGDLNLHLAIDSLIWEIQNGFDTVAIFSFTGGIILGTVHYLIVRLIRRSNHQRFRLPECGIVMLTWLVPLFLIVNHVKEANQAACSMHLRNYNQYILSMGIHRDGLEIWSDPEKTKQRVFEDYQERMPVCPSGGKVTLIPDDRYGPSIPLARCSLEGSHEHIDHSLTQEDEP